jgi:hypothetical protein
VVSFDAAFDTQPHLQLIKEQLSQTFSTPRRYHKSKPFFDHVISFSMADGAVWMRNYQVGSKRCHCMAEVSEQADRHNIIVCKPLCDPEVLCQ